MDIQQTGTSSALLDYYGVDTTYFTGSVFTKPIFDLQNTVPTAAGPIGGHNVITVDSPSFVQIDQIEITRQGIVGGHIHSDLGSDCGVYFSQGGRGKVTGGFLHDWAATTAAIKAGWSNCSGGVGNALETSGNLISAMNSTDLTLGTHVSFGGCSANHTVMFNNICEYTGQGALGFGSAHDNEFRFMSDQGATGIYSVNQIHTNIIENTFSGVETFYRNYAHDVSSIGVAMLVCPGDSVYDNVFIRTGNGIPTIQVDPAAPCTQSSSTSGIYNNTVDCTQGVLCFRITFRSGITIPTLNIKDNHWISNSTGLGVACWNSGTNCGAVTTVNQAANITMSAATASAQGYNNGNQFRPTNITNGTVAVGVNLSSLCVAGNLSALCSDAGGTPGLGGTPVSRPAVTGSGTCSGVPSSTPCWDSGGYQFPTGSTTPPAVAITAPSGTVSGSSVALSGTCVPVSATISQVFFQIDGVRFGAIGSTSPYTLSGASGWDSTTASNSNHIVVIFCTDSNGFSNSAQVTVTVSNSIPGCVVSTNDFPAPTASTISFSPQTGAFTATFTIQAFANNIDNVNGISLGVADAYTDMAMIVRQNSSGIIDVMDGTADTYHADNSAPYVSGTVYTIQVVGSLLTHKYSASMISPSSIVLATNYLFRSTQSAVASLDHINLQSDPTPNTSKLCNFTLSTTAAPTLAPPTGTYTSSQTITLADVTPGAVICYTIDNSTPTGNNAGTCTHGITYTVPFSVAVTTTVKAIATTAALLDSSVSSAVYTIQSVIPPVPPGFIYSINFPTRNSVQVAASNCAQCKFTVTCSSGCKNAQFKVIGEGNN
jgi:hypothetical protein